MVLICVLWFVKCVFYCWVYYDSFVKDGVYEVDFVDGVINVYREGNDLFKVV